MNERLTNGPALIAETVGRLRCVQEDFADESPEVRQQHLREELDRALAQLVPDQRQAFLNQVLRRFPDWESNGSEPSAAPAAAAAPANGEALMSDPDSLAERLIAAAADLPESKRQALRERLTAAGLSSAGANWPSDLAARLKLPPNAAVVPERVLEVAAVLLSSVDKIDDMAWKTWRQLDRQGVRRKPSDLKHDIMTYVAGPKDEASKGPSLEDMAGRVELFRRLASSLIYELREIETFAKQQADRFSPEKIEQVSEQGMLESAGAACWRTFKKIAADYDAAAVEREIRQRIAQHVEENLR